MTTIKIGNVMIEKTAALAPMAGVADRAFRELCKDFGASYMVSEMVSAKGLGMGSKKSAELMDLGVCEHPAAVQLFGDNPDDMARAVSLCMEYGPDIIDINMGCPAPKIAGNGGGCALMRHPDLAGEIIRKVKAEASVPVTVKFRKGWDDKTINGIEFAQMAEAAGADAVTIHGRTRAQMYAPTADWDYIKKVKEAVKVPVIGNGDVDSPEKALELYRHTGCDLIMVGRGALGAPWLFGQIRELLTTGSYTPTPDFECRMEIMVGHIAKMVEYKGEYIALREARKHCGWYLTGVRGAAALRRMAGQIQTMDDVKRLAEEAVSLQGEIADSKDVHHAKDESEC